MFPNASCGVGSQISTLKNIPLKFNCKVKLFMELNPPLLHVVMLTQEPLPALWLPVNINGTMYEQKTFIQAIALLISEVEHPRTLHVWWHRCELGTEFGDVAKATAAPGQVAALLEPGGQRFNRPGKGKKEKNKEWQAKPIKHEVECEGMYPPLFHKHLRNVHRTLFCPFNVPFHLALINFSHRLVYSNPLQGAVISP